MNRTFLRPALMLMLAATLSACGGKATFPVNVTTPTGKINEVVYDGLVYFPLVLNETVSGQTLSINKAGSSFAFPNTLEYGTSYNVTIANQPPHQECKIVNAADTAGRRAGIDVIALCLVNRRTVSGKIVIPDGDKANITGLQLVNGSDQSVPLDVLPAAPVYSFPSIKYDTPFGLTIFRQPSDGTKCTLPDKPTAFRMPDKDVELDITCKKS